MFLVAVCEFAVRQTLPEGTNLDGMRLAFLSAEGGMMEQRLPHNVWVFLCVEVTGYHTIFAKRHESIVRAGGSGGTRYVKMR